MSRPSRSHRLTRLSLASLPLLGLLACGDDDETAGGSADASSDGSADTADTADASSDGSADSAVADDTSDGGADAPDTSEPQVDPDLLEPPGYQTNAPVEVFRDEQGTAHIYGQDLRDTLFGQGYEMARDRMFHLAWLRHFMYGQRAQHYGPNYLNDDRVKRAIGFKRIASLNAQFYKDTQPEVLALLQAYAAGVNAGLADMKAGRNGFERPAEFDRIDPDWWPEPWTVVDSVAVAKATVFSQSFQPDFELAIFAGELLLGPRKFRELLPFTPMYATHILETGPSPDSLLSITGTAPDPGTLEALPEPSLTDAQRRELAAALAGAADILSEATGRPHFGSPGGSNSWAVAGAHTASGGSILCNDTHMPLDQPSRLYPTHIVDLSRNTTGAVGYIAPGAPLVLIGNTRDTAWGLTNSFADIGDLYRETISRDGTTATYNGAQRPIEIVQEQVLVRPEGGRLADATPQTVTIRRVPGRGPMLNDLLPDELRRVLDNLRYYFSVRWAGFETNTADFVTFRQLLDAGSIDDQVEALRHFDTGVMNWTLADASGAVGYIPAGPFPIRARPIADAAPYRPLDGTGGDDWQGFVDFDAIPRLLRPDKGYIVTANNSIGTGPLDNEPASAEFYFGHFFDLGSRAWRITQTLEAWKQAGNVGIEQNRALQRDNHAIVAEVYQPRLAALEPRACETPGRACDAIRLLAGWDLAQPLDSAPTAIFNLWSVHFLFDVFRDDVADPLFGLIAKDLDNVGVRATSHWLQGRTPPSGTNYFNDGRTADVDEDFDTLALRALDNALAQGADYLGPERPLASWTWGELHVALHKHVVWSDLNSTPAPQDSSFRAINPTDFQFVKNLEPAPLPYVQDEGAQIRYCVDLGTDAPTVFGQLNGGVSAHAGTPHFGDQIPGWLDEINYPVPFAQADVEASAVARSTIAAGYPSE
jgi:penicillin amidase